MVPSIEKVRFCSSGTEATMSALRLARGFTGREQVLKFAGCYHGHGDAFLISAGSGALTNGVPDSPGITEGVARDTIVIDYNDAQGVWNAFEQHGEEIAAVIVEPYVGNMGLVLPVPGFLEALRELCTGYGAVLIFDEVMTGFRLSLGGAQELYGMASGDAAPDLTTLGKIIGGGLPVGAFGGRADVMQKLAPLGPVYQAGTLSGNPLAMAAGIATLTALLLRSKEIYAQLESTTAAIANGVARIAAEHGIGLATNRVGSMFTWFFTPEAVTDFVSASTSDTAAFARFHLAMMERGVWLPPSQFEAAFVSAAHGAREVAVVLEAAREAMIEVAR